MDVKKAGSKKKKSKLRAPEDENSMTAAEKKRKSCLSKFFVAMFVVPGLFGAVASIWTYLSPPYTTIELGDSTQLRNVFFSGEPWLLTCEPYKGQPVNPIFSGLTSNAWTSGGYSLGVINCDLPMPSGKNVIDRFKLNRQKKYNRNNLAFTVANGGKPQVVPSSYFQVSKKKNVDLGTQIKSVDEYVTKKVAIRYGKVINGKQLTKQCLNKASSAIVMLEGEPSTATQAQIERLAQKFRTLWFCVVDRSKYKFSIEKQFPILSRGSSGDEENNGDAMAEGEGRLVLFRKKKVDGGGGGEEDNGKKNKSVKKDVLLARPFSGLFTGPQDVEDLIL
jgi:hypothetical protein